MKGVLHLLLLICIVCSLTGCKRNSYPPILQTADSLATAQPDSSVALLKRLDSTMQQTPQATQMYYNLLCIKANDKAYIPHTSDSLILSVLNYYTQKGNKQHLPEAYYYGGRVYRDLGDAPLALDYFQKAKEALQQSEVSELAGKIYSQMGSLFLFQDLYHEAIEMFKKAQEINLKLENHTSVVFNLRDIACGYRSCNQADSSIVYFQEAYKLASSLSNKKLTSLIESQMAALYLEQGKYDLAKRYIQGSLAELDIPSKSGIFSIAAKLYHQTGVIDSATYYYQELLVCGTIYAKEIAYKGLAEIALNKKQPQEAATYLSQYKYYIDSIQSITYTESLHRMQALYNYQLREKEILRLKSESEKNQRLIVTFGLLFTLLLVSSLAFMFYFKWGKAKLALKLDKINLLKREQERKSLNTLNEHRKRIETLKKEIDKVDKINLTLIAQLEEQKEEVVYACKELERELKNREDAKSFFEKSDFHCILRSKIKKQDTLSQEEWQELEESINRSYANFSENLYALHPLKEHEHRVCLLLKANCTFVEIASLTSRSKNAIISTCRRLYSKMFLQEGSSKSLVSFINSL